MGSRQYSCLSMREDEESARAMQGGGNGQATGGSQRPARVGSFSAEACQRCRRSSCSPWLCRPPTCGSAGLSCPAAGLPAPPLGGGGGVGGGGVRDRLAELDSAIDRAFGCLPSSRARVGAVLKVCRPFPLEREPPQHPGDVGRGTALDVLESAPVQCPELSRLEACPGDHIIIDPEVEHEQHRVVPATPRR